MKLIVGLLTLLCVARLAHCGNTIAVTTSQPAYDMKNHDPAYLTFSDGFDDGTQVTFFYKYLDPVKKGSVYINFYADPELDPLTLKTDGKVKGNYPEIIAHIAINPDDTNKHVVQTDTFVKSMPSAIPQSLQKKTHCCDTALPKLVGTGPNKDWWRVDIYKFDDSHLNVFVQGFSFKEHLFTKGNLKVIKSAYIFNLIDTNDVYIKYRIPGLVQPTPLAKFKAMVERTMKETSGNAPVAKRNTLTPPTPFDAKKSESTSVNTVKIHKFVKNAKIFITAWMGSKEENQKDMKKPRIQFRQEGPKEGMNQQGVFTFYHAWNNKKRESYIDVLHWKPLEEDKCTTKDNEIIKCEPVKCVVDGSTSDLEHYQIERTGEKEIEVTTYYAGADPSVGIMGTSCKTTTTLIGKLKPDLDAVNFVIHGLNGAMILHADMQ